MHLNSIAIFHKYVLPLISVDTKVLEIGPSDLPSNHYDIFKHYNGSPVKQWDTLDIRHHKDLTYPSSHPYEFAIPDNSYDLVFSSQVFEHVPQVWTWIKEQARVCRVGGRVATVCPLSWPYHKSPKDTGYDCWRAYPDGVIACYTYAGLDVETAWYGSLMAKQYDTVVIGIKEKYERL